MGIAEIKKIAVIGSGTMGPGIAQVFAVAGYDVHLCDISEKAIERARLVVKGNLDTLVENNVISPPVVENTQRRIAFTTSLDEAVFDADFVAECIVEDRDAKRELFRYLDGVCPRDALIASNTSYLNVFELTVEPRLANTVIAHWFAPPHILPLVEVVRGPKTSDAAVQSVLDLLRKADKVPVVMDKFVPGFAINRLQRILGREIFFLLDNGFIRADQLDLAVKASIAPRMMLLGLVQRYDFTGLDLSAKNLENQEFTEAPVDNRPRSLFRLVERGHLGVKSGKGFYDYTDKPSIETLKERDRLLLRILKNTDFCLRQTIGKFEEAEDD
ncbi:MAG TPA: 3-hydroxyacyl-CoA dehydrogenase family protein [Syntrophorhabdales bacterium]|nr:3-hydroxyacyl-CoA dehydrogenase family protein [Syntrophorhabdales bacterium]